MGTTRFVGRCGNGFVRSLVIAYVYLMFTAFARGHNDNVMLRRNKIINTNDLRGELQSMEREHLRLKEEARLSLTPCKLCVYIVEKIKESHGKMPLGVCSTLVHKAGNDFGSFLTTTCNMIADAVGNEIQGMRHWLDKGCLRKDAASVSVVKPCPSQEICSQLSSLLGKPFCKPPKAHPSGGDKCQACKLVMERVKQGYGEQGTLQDICIEAAHKGHKELQPYCEMVLNSLLKWGDKFKGWLENGCKQDENDGESENVKPCPDEFMCHQMQDLVEKPFCPKPFMG